MKSPGARIIIRAILTLSTESLSDAATKPHLYKQSMSARVSGIMPYLLKRQTNTTCMQSKHGYRQY